jgi:hypothetical protein
MNTEYTNTDPPTFHNSFDGCVEAHLRLVFESHIAKDLFVSVLVSYLVLLLVSIRSL